MTAKSIATKKPRGRPSKPIPKLDVSPEKIAKAAFSAVKKPDPKIRIARKRAVETAS